MSRKKSTKSVKTAKGPGKSARRMDHEKVRCEERDARLMRSYLEGKTQREIGIEYGLSQPAVGLILSEIRREWRESALLDMDQRKEQELAKIDRIEGEAWEAWHKSQQPTETYHKRTRFMREKVKGSGRRGAPPKYNVIPMEDVEENRQVGQSGDPRFLEQAFKCVEMRLKILGLLKAGEGGTHNVININWGDMHDEPKRENRVTARINSLKTMPAGPALPDPSKQNKPVFETSPNQELVYEDEEGDDG